MKKDIEIPVVKNVSVAIIHEWNEEYLAKDWTVYIINERQEPIEMVLVVSKGFDGDKKTSIMRHGIGVVGAKSFEKIEMLQEDLFALNNEFYVTFFADNKLYEKKFLFEKNTISEANLAPISVINKDGILAE